MSGLRSGWNQHSVRASLSPIMLAGGVNMRAWDSRTHSFIVKIWLEETAEEAGKARWRGHITHVGDEQRRYVETLDELSTFIEPYLKEMGIRFEPRSRLGRWLGRWIGRNT